MRNMLLVMLALMLVLSACVSNKTYKAQQSKVQVLEGRQKSQDAELEMARKDIIKNREKIDNLIISVNGVNEQLLVLDPMQDEIVNTASAIVGLQGDVAAINSQLNDAIAANAKLDQKIAALTTDTNDTFDAYSDYMKQMKNAQSAFATKEELLQLATESTQLAKTLDDLTTEVEAIALYLDEQDAILAQLEQMTEDQAAMNKNIANEKSQLALDVAGLTDEVGAMAGYLDAQNDKLASLEESIEYQAIFNQNMAEENQALMDFRDAQIGMTDSQVKSDAKEKEELWSEIKRIRGQLTDSQTELVSIHRSLETDVDELKQTNTEVISDMSELQDRVYAVNSDLTALTSDLQDIIAKERATAEKRRQETMVKQYKVALNEYNKGKHENSIILFEQFLQANPDCALSPNAYYWIGENYYSAANYPKALRQFQAVIDRYPEHDKALDAQVEDRPHLLSDEGLRIQQS